MAKFSFWYAVGGAGLMSLAACSIVSGLDDVDAIEGAGGQGATEGQGGGISIGPGSSSGSGAAGVTTSSTGGSGPGEDCLNGVDDDGDNLVDCDDPDCQPDYQCVPSDPAANGYLSQPDVGDVCPGETTTISMSECTCDGCIATSGSCTIEVTLDDSGDCNTPFATNSSGQCNPGPPSGSTRYLEMVAITNNQDGNCTPNSATVPPTINEVCETVEPGSCSNGDVCVRRPANAQRDCIRVPLRTTCPGTYPQLINGFEGAPAGDCNCECNDAGSSCDQAYALTYNNNSCNGAGNTTFLSLNQCSGAVFNVDAVGVPLLGTTQTCAESVSLPGTTPSQLCCSSVN